MSSLGWAAGFFDGEGSTYAKPAPCGKAKKRLYLSVSLGNTDLDQLHRFQATLGGLGSIGRRRVTPNRRPMWTWNADGKTAERVLELLWPELGAAKRAQAEAARQRVATQPPPLSRQERGVLSGIARRSSRSAKQTEQLPGIGEYGGVLRGGA